ncbi:MAG TPA: paraquat-inducible protein A [Epsilonproteobacteria bacterium]|nr:paraquat-inducible protein A [Campylobacterota bacterium]
MKTKLSLFILTILVGLMSYLGFQAHTHAKLHEAYRFELAAQQKLETLTEHQALEFLEDISLGLYKSKKKMGIKEIETNSAFHQRAALEYTVAAVVVLLLVLLSYLFVSLQLFSFVAGVSAFIMLTVGLGTPIMMVTIHKKVEYIGDVVLSFESKGVLGSIEKLWEGGETGIALVILLFSVVVPMSKTLFLLFVTLVAQSAFAHSVVKFFKVLGKWSMLDVFVVATFLVYLTSNSSDVSRAEVQVGLYFFLCYVMVSMLVSLSVDKLLERVKA